MLAVGLESFQAIISHLHRNSTYKLNSLSRPPFYFVRYSPECPTPFQTATQHQSQIITFRHQVISLESKEVGQIREVILSPEMMRSGDTAVMTKPRIPEVEILWWDAGNLCVQCPYCLGTHSHTRSHTSYDCEVHIAPCSEDSSYRCCFPIDNVSGLVAYQLDKSEAQFVNEGLPKDEDEDQNENQDTDSSHGDDESEELANEFSKVAISEDHDKKFDSYPNINKNAREIVRFNLGPSSNCPKNSEKSTVRAVRNCVGGRVAKVQKYLSRSSETSLFIHGRDDTGSTTLIMAAAIVCPEMIALLLEHGAEIDAVNRKGRTALMEASLGVRVENVSLLLEKGANKSLRDDEKCTAYDLAQATPENLRRRGYKYTAIKPGFAGEEDDRRKIIILLAAEDIKSKTVYGSPPSESECRSYSFKRFPSQPSPCVLFRSPTGSTEYPLTNARKAIGILLRGGRYPDIAAMSGWTFNPFLYLNEGVIELAEEIGYKLPSDKKDKGVPGRYFACHAEMELIAYFINHHVFLPRDRVPNPEIEAEIDQTLKKLNLRTRHHSSPELKILRRLLKERKLLEIVSEAYDVRGSKYDQANTRQLANELEAIRSEIENLKASDEYKEIGELLGVLESLEKRKEKHEELVEMARNAPEVSLKEAVILISSHSREICGNCKEFVKCVNEFFGLSIRIYERTEM